MSLWDDYMADCLFERDYPFGIPAYKDPEWTTRDLRTIKVSEMTASHIRNCLNIVRGVSDEWEEVFKQELRKRGLTDA